MCFCISFTQKMCEIAKVAKVSASFFSIISKWKWSLVSTISDRIRYLILDFRGFSSWWNKQTGEKNCVFKICNWFNDFFIIIIFFGGLKFCLWKIINICHKKCDGKTPKPIFWVYYPIRHKYLWYTEKKPCSSVISILLGIFTCVHSLEG